MTECRPVSSFPLPQQLPVELQLWRGSHWGYVLSKVYDREVTPASGEEIAIDAAES